ncbi:MAG: hypothetical protein GVY18_03555 [Bacteroidetes bacterium]|nr:hypothetical protein [Bacteroidota bacterium]
MLVADRSEQPPPVEAPRGLTSGIIKEATSAPDDALVVSYEDLVAWAGPVPERAMCDCGPGRERACHECYGTGRDCLNCDGMGWWLCEKCDSQRIRLDRFSLSLPRPGLIVGVCVDLERLALLLSVAEAEEVKLWPVIREGLYWPGQLGLDWADKFATLMGCKRSRDPKRWEP